MIPIQNNDDPHPVSGGPENPFSGRLQVTSGLVFIPFILTYCINPAPFPESFFHFGCQTVRPYVGAVNSPPLHIVSQAINGSDAGF
jgi:hypothetical protein